jgi:phospholipid transport system substrate-binding protein
MLMAAALALALGGRVAMAAPDPAAARAMIEDVGSEVLKVLGSNELPAAEQIEQLKMLLGDAIDMEMTGRLILGQHWRRASEDQRTEYLKLFAPYALDNLASKIRAANSKVPLSRFEITGIKAASEKDIVVSTDLFWPGYAPYELDWRLRAGEDGKLRAIDVVVEGVSMVISQRSEFAAIVERQGLDGLLAQMRQRVDRTA